MHVQFGAFVLYPGVNPNPAEAMRKKSPVLDKAIRDTGYVFLNLNDHPPVLNNQKKWYSATISPLSTIKVNQTSFSIRTPAVMFDEEFNNENGEDVLPQLAQALHDTDTFVRENKKSNNNV